MLKSKYPLTVFGLMTYVIKANGGQKARALIQYDWCPLRECIELVPILSLCLLLALNTQDKVQAKLWQELSEGENPGEHLHWKPYGLHS